MGGYRIRSYEGRTIYVGADSMSARLRHSPRNASNSAKDP